jgi:hypothetical protein
MKTTGRKTIRAKESAPKSVKAAAQTTANAGVTKRATTVEEIARRSYELYLARGAQPGHEKEDWLAAEAELLGK